MDFLLGLEGGELLGRHSQRRAKWDRSLNFPLLKEQQNSNKIKGYMNYMVNDEILSNSITANANAESDFFLKKKKTSYFLSWSFSIYTNTNTYYPNAVNC